MGRRPKKGRRRYRWAERDTWIALFWAGAGFAAGTYHGTHGGGW